MNNPERGKHWRPRLAILAMGSLAVGYDIICPKGQTISEEVDYLRENPKTGRVTNWLLDALYNHLKRIGPPEEDPIHKLAQYIGKD